MIKNKILESIETKKKFLEQGVLDLERAINLIWQTLSSGRKVLICGNGGSAADAQHFAAELVIRYRKNRRALPAIALTTDTSIITAGTNDFSFDEVFARQVEALGNSGDVFIGISTSGQSRNVIRAAELARQKQLKVISLIGARSSLLENISDVCIRVPSENTGRIQEVHELCLHIIAESLEERLLREEGR